MITHVTGTAWPGSLKSYVHRSQIGSIYACSLWMKRLRRVFNQ